MNMFHLYKLPGRSGSVNEVIIYIHVDGWIHRQTRTHRHIYIYIYRERARVRERYRCTYSYMNMFHLYKLPGHSGSVKEVKYIYLYICMYISTSSASAPILFLGSALCCLMNREIDICTCIYIVYLYKLPGHTGSVHEVRCLVFICLHACV